MASASASPAAPLSPASQPPPLAAQAFPGPHHAQHQRPGHGKANTQEVLANAASRQEVRLWVRRSGHSEDTAIAFELPLAATVSDLLREVHAVLVKPSYEHVQTLELAVRGRPLSNLLSIQDALIAEVGGVHLSVNANAAAAASLTPTVLAAPPPSSSTAAAADGAGSHQPPLVFELRRRFRRGTGAVSASDVPQAAHTVSSPRQRTRTPPQRHRSRSPQRGIPLNPTSPAGQHEPPLDCVFEPQWGSPMCAACGLHRRSHDQFPVSRVEMQDKLIQSAQKSKSKKKKRNAGGGGSDSGDDDGSGDSDHGGRGLHRTPTNTSSHYSGHTHQHGGASSPRLWEPKQRRTATPSRLKAPTPCAHFQASWGRAQWCQECGHAVADHAEASRRSTTTPTRRTMSPSASTVRRRTRSPAAARAGTPRTPGSYMAPTAAHILRSTLADDHQHARTPRSPPPSSQHHQHQHAASPFDLHAQRVRLAGRSLQRSATKDANDDNGSDGTPVRVTQIALPGDPCTHSTHRRRVCDAFAPLWNHNSFCTHCYNPRSVHPDVRRREREQRALGALLAEEEASSAAAMMASPYLAGASGRGGSGRGKPTARAVGGDEEVRARFCAVPWHYVLTFCAVEDLLRSAQVCRILALAARPLLHSTMSIVAGYPPPAPPPNIRDAAVDVAEVLTMEAVGSPLYDAIISVIFAILRAFARGGFDPAETPTETLSDFVSLVRQLAAVTPRANAVLPKDFGPLSLRLERVHASLMQTAPDNAAAILPIVHFAHVLWHQHRIQAAAARYLSADRVSL